MVVNASISVSADHAHCVQITRVPPSLELTFENWPHCGQVTVSSTFHSK